MEKTDKVIKVEKIIHKGYLEFKRAKKEGNPIRQVVGKYQYLYSSDKGEISLVELLSYFKEGEDLWEIYCLQGKLFEDVERFETKEEAEKRIQELLNGKNNPKRE